MKKRLTLAAGLTLILSTQVIAGVVGQPGSEGHPKQDGDLTTQPLAKIAPYPKAQKGMSRHVIYLPTKSNEGNYQVELLIGKTIEVDCNQVVIGGELKTHRLEGWGYDYVVLDKLSAPASTMMACLNRVKTKTFVAAHLGPAAFQRYNSRLPIVVYAPNDVTVKYRIWQANSKIELAQKK